MPLGPLVLSEQREQLGLKARLVLKVLQDFKASTELLEQQVPPVLKAYREFRVSQELQGRLVLLVPKVFRVFRVLLELQELQAQRDHRVPLALKVVAVLQIALYNKIITMAPADLLVVKYGSLMQMVLFGFNRPLLLLHLVWRCFRLEAQQPQSSKLLRRQEPFKEDQQGHMDLECQSHPEYLGHPGDLELQ